MNADEVLQLLPNGTGQRVMIGSDLAAGERPQVVVPRGVWQVLGWWMRPVGSAGMHSQPWV